MSQLKVDNRFFDTKIYRILTLKQNKLVEIVHQKYGLYSLPDGS